MRAPYLSYDTVLKLVIALVPMNEASFVDLNVVLLSCCVYLFAQSSSGFYFGVVFVYIVYFYLVFSSNLQVTSVRFPMLIIDFCSLVT